MVVRSESPDSSGAPRARREGHSARRGIARWLLPAAVAAVLAGCVGGSGPRPVGGTATPASAPSARGVGAPTAPTAPTAPPDARAPAAGSAPAVPAPPGPTVAVTAAPADRISPERLPGFAADSLDGLSAAIGRQCRMASPPEPWPMLCPEWRALPAGAAALRRWLAERFEAVPLAGRDGSGTQGLITGYHEPIVTGSRVRESARQVALLRKPPDLLRVEVGERDGASARLPSPVRGRLVGDRVLPYPTRAEIEAGAVPPGLELLWLDDPVDAFFLQIQGSGRVRLRDGSVARVGFADTNGQPYRAIGRTLIERGALPPDQVDAPAIKAWLRAHPEAAPAVMQSNPRYVFFRELPAGAADDGPPGSLGVSLTPLRSVAVDPRHVPAGALLWLDTTNPADGTPIARAVLAQDTGAAITGAVRADLFWGAGDEPERMAGLMKQPGRLWTLLPKAAGAAR